MCNCVHMFLYTREFYCMMHADMHVPTHTHRHIPTYRWKMVEAHLYLHRILLAFRKRFNMLRCAQQVRPSATGVSATSAGNRQGFDGNCFLTWKCVCVVSVG